jgi:histidinol phosphatase-like enzyme
MKSALILTLDKTVVSPISRNQESVHPSDWRFNPKVLDVIKHYSSLHYKILIVSNQLAVYNGLVTEKMFLRKMNLIVNKIEEELKLIQNSVCYSYCTDINSYNFLPKPGMLYEFALDHEIDLHDSIVVGSSVYDSSIAVYSGAKYIDINLIEY